MLKNIKPPYPSTNHWEESHPTNFHHPWLHQVGLDGGSIEGDAEHQQIAAGDTWNWSWGMEKLRDSGWFMFWFVVWNIFPHMLNNNPNWLIFFRGLKPPTSVGSYQKIGGLMVFSGVEWKHTGTPSPLKMFGGKNRLDSERWYDGYRWYVHGNPWNGLRLHGYS